MCGKRGQCKARFTTRNGLVIVKLNGIKEIQYSHIHGPGVPRIDMLKGYNQMKERAKENSEESTSLFSLMGLRPWGIRALLYQIIENQFNNKNYSQAQEWS